MPSNVVQASPEEATGPRHIAEPANALVERINATRHPNVVAMHDAIDRWVRHAFEAGGQAGIDYLARCQARIDLNRQNLADWASDRGELFGGMEGVTNWDLIAAEARIGRAVDQLRSEPPGINRWMTDAERAACEA